MTDVNVHINSSMGVNTGFDFSPGTLDSSNSPSLTRSDNLETLNLDSETLDTANWTKTKATYSDKKLIEDNSAGSTHYINMAPQSVKVFAGTRYRIRAKVKYGTRHCSIYFGSSGGWSAYAHFNLQTGAIVSTDSNIYNAKVINDPCVHGSVIISAESIATTTTTITSGIYLASTPGITAYDGNGTGYIWVDWVQFHTAESDEVYLKTASLPQYHGINGRPMFYFHGNTASHLSQLRGDLTDTQTTSSVNTMSNLLSGSRDFTIVGSFQPETLDSQTVFSVSDQMHIPKDFTATSFAGEISNKKLLISIKTGNGDLTTISDNVYPGINYFAFKKTNLTLSLKVNDRDWVTTDAPFLSQTPNASLPLYANVTNYNLQLGRNVQDTNYFQGRMGDFIVYNCSLPNWHCEELICYEYSLYGNTNDLESISYISTLNLVASLNSPFTSVAGVSVVTVPNKTIRLFRRQLTTAITEPEFVNTVVMNLSTTVYQPVITVGPETITAYTLELTTVVKDPLIVLTFNLVLGLIDPEVHFGAAIDAPTIGLLQIGAPIIVTNLAEPPVIRATFGVYEPEVISNVATPSVINMYVFIPENYPPWQASYPGDFETGFIPAYQHKLADFQENTLNTYSLIGNFSSYGTVAPNPPFTHPEQFGSRWVGGVMGPSGHIYGIPFDAETILKINPVDDTTTTIGSFPHMSDPDWIYWYGEDWTWGGNKWAGGVLAPNGCIYGIPYLAQSVLKIDTSNDSVTTFGNFPWTNPVDGYLSDEATAEDFKWWSGILAPNGQIYGSPDACGYPSTCTKILKIDPETDTIRFIGESFLKSMIAGGIMGASLTAGVLAPNGCIYYAPWFTGSYNSWWTTIMLKIDTNTDTLSIAHGWPGGQPGGIGFGWSGGVLGPDGKIYFTPNSGSYGNPPSQPSQPCPIMVLDPLDDSITYLEDEWTTGNLWEYGVMATNGWFYAAPETYAYSNSEGNILCADIENLETTTIGTFPNASPWVRWGGGILAQNGSIYCMPFDCFKILKINATSTPNVPLNRCLSRYYNKR